MQSVGNMRFKIHDNLATWIKNGPIYRKLYSSNHSLKPQECHVLVERARRSRCLTWHRPRPQKTPLPVTLYLPGSLAVVSPPSGHSGLLKKKKNIFNQAASSSSSPAAVPNRQQLRVKSKLNVGDAGSSKSPQEAALFQLEVQGACDRNFLLLIYGRLQAGLLKTEWWRPVEQKQTARGCWRGSHVSIFHLHVGLSSVTAVVGGRTQFIWLF